MTTRFLQWWLAFVVQTILIGTTCYFGSIDYLYDNDKTFISFTIVSIWFITSLSIGLFMYRKIAISEFQWFISDSCMSLGMIGTLIGFILMLGGSLGEIDPSNIESMKKVISDMALGMSTALLTTLAGLIASLFLRIQLVIAELE